jgi:hypothetical protein
LLKFTFSVLTGVVGGSGANATSSAGESYPPPQLNNAIVEALSSTTFTVLFSKKLMSMCSFKIIYKLSIDNIVLNANKRVDFVSFV